MDDGCFPHTTHRLAYLPQMGQMHSGAITNGTRSVGFGLGEAGAASSQNPGADVAGGEPSPGADVGRVSGISVQMAAGSVRGSHAAAMWQG
jgi:hypothetical protein